MRHFLIYTNLHKDADLTVTNQIKSYLTDRGQRVTVKVKETDWKSQPGESSASEDEALQGACCMIVLGGDGTMLQAVREMGRFSIPMIGVNLGTLGYMTEIEPRNLEEALERLIAGEYEQERRMMISGRVFFQDGKESDGWALNDIVLTRAGSLQIIKYNIYVNGQFLNTYNADGVIVTTPTGSTGYNLSAGGPLVDPKAKLMMLTPICPHTLNRRSIVFAPEDVIEIEIPKGKEGQKQAVEVTFDGSHMISLNTGDRIRVLKSEKTMDFIRLNQVSFLEVLHKKMSEN